MYYKKKLHQPEAFNYPFHLSSRHHYCRDFSILIPYFPFLEGSFAIISCPSQRGVRCHGDKHIGEEARHPSKGF